LKHVLLNASTVMRSNLSHCPRVKKAAKTAWI